MDKRKDNKGVVGNKGGRIPKAQEQKLIEKLSPLDPLAFKALNKALVDGERWAVELWFKYYFGLPKQIVEQTNVNIEAKDLTEEEIKLINNNLERTY